jgi:hypothetical protein
VAVAVAVGGVAVGCGLFGVAVASRRIRNELNAVLAAEQQRTRDGGHVRPQEDRGRVELGLLERGTVLLTDLIQAAAEMDLDQRGRAPTTDAWRELGRELAVFQGQLSLWFDDRSEVLAAFEDAVQLTAWRATWVGELGHVARRPEERRTPEDVLEELVVARQRYITAARAHLRR